MLNSIKVKVLSPLPKDIRSSILKIVPFWLEVTLEIQTQWEPMLVVEKVFYF
jgi:hypothetical protein